MAVGSDTAMAAQERIAAPKQQADLARLVRSGRAARRQTEEE
jgi:hypothetical protein